MDVSWTIKKAECWKIYAFELWCWRRLLRVPWTTRISELSILKEIHPDYSSEGLMLKLKHQYFGCLMQRVNSLEKTLMLGKIEGRRRRGDRGQDGWMASLTQWTWVWANSEIYWKTGKPGVLQFLGLQIRTLLSNWTAKILCWLLIFKLFLLGFYLARQGGIQQTASEVLSYSSIKKEILSSGSSQFGFLWLLKTLKNLFPCPILNTVCGTLSSMLPILHRISESESQRLLVYRYSNDFCNTFYNFTEV